MDGARGAEAGRDRHPLHRLAGQRRHLRDRPDHRGAASRRARRGHRPRPRRLRAPVARLGQPDAVGHLARAARRPAPGSHQRAGGRRTRPPPRDLQLPRPAVQLQPRRGPEARRGDEVRRRRSGARLGRIPGGSGLDPRIRTCALASRAHPRGPRCGQARSDAGGELGQRLRGRCPRGRDRRSRREERRGAQLPIDQRLAFPTLWGFPRELIETQGEEGSVTTATQEAPTLFLRKATGLVKGWSGFDAFAYSFMSVNLVTLGMFYSLATFAFVPDGSPIASIVLSAIGVTFMAIAYAGLIAVMPRAGGDYVWQSRILDGIPGMISGAVVGGVLLYLVAGAAGQADPIPWGAGVVGVVVGAAIGRLNGGIGFILAATGWWFILAQWAPIYGAILNIEFFQPLAALTGQLDALTFLGSNDGIFFVSIVVILLTTVLVGLGMAGYATVQRVCLWAGLAGLAVMFVLMLISTQDQFKTAFDSANASMFGVEGAYDKTIADATANNFFTGPTRLNPLEFGTGTLMLIPFMLFWILYPNWGSTLYGEVRGASDFRKVLRGMLGGLWVTALLAIVFIVLAAKTFGWEFYNATNVNFLYYFYAYSDTATLPIWSYPPLIASYLVDSNIFQMAMVIVFGAWFLGWSGTLFLRSEER